MKISKSAGGIVLNSEGKMVIVNQNSNSWSLPKGHVESGENKLEAAKREIFEESGITELKLLKDLGTYSRYRIGKSRAEDKSEKKEISIFLFRTNQIKLNPQDKNNPEAKWVTKEEALELLSHSADKKFLLKHFKEI